MVLPETHKALESMGEFGESFDDVIQRVIKRSKDYGPVLKEYEELRSHVVGLCICYECDERWFIDSPYEIDPEMAHCENCGATGRNKIKVFGP